MKKNNLKRVPFQMLNEAVKIFNHNHPDSYIETYNLNKGDKLEVFLEGVYLLGEKAHPCVVALYNSFLDLLDGDVVDMDELSEYVEQYKVKKVKSPKKSVDKSIYKDKKGKTEFGSRRNSQAGLIDESILKGNVLLSDIVRDTGLSEKRCLEHVKTLREKGFNINVNEYY